MFHAFFRSILRVLPLLLVLSPVNSSSCAMGNRTTEIRVKYENILSHDIHELVNMSAEYRDRCCKNKKHENSKVFFCNDTQEIEALQSMACNMLRFFHKQKISKDFRWRAALVSCGTLQVLQCKCERHKKEKEQLDVKIFGFLIIGRLCSLTCHSNLVTYREKEHSFKCGSQLPVEHKNIDQCQKASPQVCTQVNMHNNDDTETDEQCKKKCNQELCELKENISSLRSCWNKFEKIISR